MGHDYEQLPMRPPSIPLPITHLFLHVSSQQHPPPHLHPNPKSLQDHNLTLQINQRGKDQHRNSEVSYQIAGLFDKEWQCWIVRRGGWVFCMVCWGEDGEFWSVELWRGDCYGGL